jgi:hypothetical protein
MEKCSEKLVVLESFDQNSSSSSSNRLMAGMNSTAENGAGNLIYQQLSDMGIDENIILCWETYSIPLQELVKSLSVYEKNMLEYYR